MTRSLCEQVHRTGKRILLSILKNEIFLHSLVFLSRRGCLPKLLWKRFPVSQTFPVAVDPHLSFFYSSHANDAIGRSLFWKGSFGHERETTTIFHKLAQRSSLILDIGANTGIYTLLACAANSQCRVISFEPTPKIFSILEENVRINSYSSRCTLISQAVADYEGVAQFHIPHSDIPTSASFHIDGFRGYRGDLVPVQVTTVDAICREDTLVDLVKIDVEGFEDRVLDGMQHVLAIHRPTIIVECNPDGPYENIERILKKYIYQFYHLKAQGPFKMERIIPDRRERFRNYLCLPCEKVGTVIY